MARIGRSMVAVIMCLWSASVFSQAITATATHRGNLRRTPSTAHPPIRELMVGETLTVVTTTQVNSYYHVRTTAGEDGWIYRNSVQLSALPNPPAPSTPTPPPPPPSTPPSPTPAACGVGVEIVVNASCPAVGEHGNPLVAYAATSDGGLRKLAKRHVPDPACTPRPLTLDDMRAMQNYMDNTFGDARTKTTGFTPTRSLKNIFTFNGSASEGDLIALMAYLIIARDEGSESVNCGGNDGTDILSGIRSLRRRRAVLFFIERSLCALMAPNNSMRPTHEGLRAADAGRQVDIG